MKLRFLLFVLALLLSVNSAYAQFEGQIKMKLYSENENGDKEENLLNMYITADRIMLQGDESVNFESGINAQGLLIRNDKKDFVVLTGDQSALQITKKDIESLISFTKQFSDDNSSASEKSASYRYTNESRMINGMKATELIVEDNEDGGYLSIWLTPDVDINWGMLTESWGGLDNEMDKALKTSQEAVFNGKSFPLLIEAYSKKNNEKTVVAEVVELNESSIAKAMVEIPRGVNIMGFGDFMFKMMMQNQN